MVTLKFHDANFKRDIDIQIKISTTNQLLIEINGFNGEEYSCINLDKSTAIKLSKELRKQIALLD